MHVHTSPSRPVRLLIAVGMIGMCWILMSGRTGRVVAEETAEAVRPQVLHRIAFGSCDTQDHPQLIWDDVVAVKPDLFLFLGDNIYADTEDMALMKAKYGILGAAPGYQKLLKTCPVLATWDDHDFGVNDGGAAYPKKVESQQIMLDFFGVPKDSVRRKRPGVYGSYLFGPPGKRVQVILLDTRYFRSQPKKDTRPEAEKQQQKLVGWYVPHPDPATTILGPDQWKWLERQLQVPAEVRIIGSSFQVVADEKGMESWGNFPHERRRLYDLIGATKANGVLLISGDVHFSEISRTNDGPYPLTDFTSSSLTDPEKSWSEAINTHRISQSAYVKPTFGYIQIDWSQADPQITLQARGLKADVGFENVIELSELQP